MLHNEHVVIEHGGAELVLAGVPDYSAGHFDEAHRSDPQAALAGAPDGAVKVLLAHQPRSAAAAAAAGFDLQLSGHTHGGQFLPWSFFVQFQQPFTAGLHRLGRMWVYVSRGTGYWGPPKRFGAPSEITEMRLMPLPSESYKDGGALSDTAEVGAGQKLPVWHVPHPFPPPSPAPAPATSTTSARRVAAANSSCSIPTVSRTRPTWSPSARTRNAPTWSGKASSARPTFASCWPAASSAQIADTAVRIESRTNLLFSFEKMALRDAVKTPAGARLFATELYAFLWGRGSPQRKFEDWVQAVADLPRTADPGADLAAGDGVRLHRPARQAPVPQADGDPQGGARLWLRLRSTAHSRPGRSTSRC